MAFALVPKIGDGLTPQTAFRPKYTDPGDLGAGNDLVGYVAMDYGLEAAVLIRVVLSGAQRTALAAKADALVVPANMDALVSAGALTQIQTLLEAVNLPAQWVTTSITYRQVLKGFRRVITFMQRWRGMFAVRVFGGGITLDSTLNDLTATQRQRLADVSDSFNLDRSAVVNTMTLRAVLKLLADQLPDMDLGGESI